MVWAAIFFHQGIFEETSMLSFGCPGLSAEPGGGPQNLDNVLSSDSAEMKEADMSKNAKITAANLKLKRHWLPSRTKPPLPIWRNIPWLIPQ
jgi:hypothetical protein